MSIVGGMADKIIVMKDGKFNEIDFSENIYNNPKTDYTRKLIESIPKGVN